MYAIVAGGGKVGFFLARELIDQGHEVLIIENNPERAEFIANELGNVVLRGNADEASTLAEAGAERADVVIAVTGDDLRNPDVEVVEAVVDARSRVTGQPLNSVDLPPESTIAVVIRKGSAFFPNGA